MSGAAMDLATCDSCRHRHCCGSQDIDACREGGAILTWEPWTNDDMGRIRQWVGRLEWEYRRTRISQLRRMVSSINSVIERTLIYAETEDEYDKKRRRMRERFARFAKACLAEIERLRGMG